MKNKIILVGLAGSLILGNVSFAKDGNNMDKSIKKKFNSPLVIDSKIDLNKISITTKTIVSDIDNADINVKIPVIKGLKDKVYQEQLNYTIKEIAEKDLKKFKEEVKELEKLNVKWKPELKIGYEVKSKGDILSFVINYYSYTGGANGIGRKDYYNIDVEENKAIKLEDLFKENSNFKTIINDEISKQIKEEISKNENSYFKGEKGFKSIKDGQSFYINQKGNLVITFQLYEIAPRSTGYPEFEIPKESIIHVLKDTKSVTIKEPVIIKDKYYNEKYGFEFKIAPIWKNKIKVVEDYNTDNEKLKVDFIYSPANRKTDGEKLLTISVLDKREYKKDEKSFVIRKDKNHVYLATTYENPFEKDNSLGKEYEKLSRVLDGIDDLFKITNYEKSVDLARIIVNGKELKLKNSMFKSDNGTIMMPLAEVAKALDFKVKWDGKNKVVNINKGAVSAGVYINEDKYYFSKDFIYLDEGAQIIKGKTYVPINFVDKVLKGEMTTNENGTFNIKY